MIAQRYKVPARHLMPGDQVGSGETVVKVSTGIRTPRGKVEALGLILSELTSLALGADCAALSMYAAALSTNLTTLQLICSTCVADPRKEVKRQP